MTNHIGSSSMSYQLLAYRRPPWIMLHLIDPLTVLAVGRLGQVDHNGTRVLEVKGRMGCTPASRVYAEVSAAARLQGTTQASAPARE